MRNPLGGRDAADCRLARKARPFREYAARFAENRIDFSVLRDLTDQDLKDLSVVLGDRRKMLRAIGELDAASPAAPATSTGLVSQDAAERRQVTVMFSDLVGSTALSARMDPEDLREVISAYQKCVAETVRRFGGFVAKYMGDGVLVYFGYPQAHEDDAERAVRAGLKLIAAVSALKSPVSLQTRVGISTGLVVVGDLIGSGEAQEDAADANIVVFSATDSATEAQEDANLGHGIFTYALAEGLNGKADLMNKGAVNITGLFNFVSSEVYDLSEGEQEPTFSSVA